MTFIILFTIFFLSEVSSNFATWLAANFAQQHLLIEPSMDNFPCRFNLCLYSANPLIVPGENNRIPVVFLMHWVFIKIITRFSTFRDPGCASALRPNWKGLHVEPGWSFTKALFWLIQFHLWTVTMCSFNKVFI